MQITGRQAAPFRLSKASPAFSWLLWIWRLQQQVETKERVLNDNNVNANIIANNEKDTNEVEMSPKKRKVQPAFLQSGQGVFAVVSCTSATVVCPVLQPVSIPFPSFSCHDLW